MTNGRRVGDTVAGLGSPFSKCQPELSGSELPDTREKDKRQEGGEEVGDEGELKNDCRLCQRNQLRNT